VPERPSGSLPVTRKPVVALALAPRLCEGMFGAEHLARLRAVCDVPDAEPLARLDDARAAALLRDAEILLTSWGCPRLDAAVLERAPRLEAVIHAAGTVKGHVTPAVFERGVHVTSAAAANAVPVAEFTLAAILFSNKRVLRMSRRYAEVRGFRFWAEECPDPGNLGKTVGIVGASRIGRRVIELLRPFDLSVIAHDPTLDAGQIRSLGAEPVQLDELLATSDVVSLHAPAVAATRHLLDARRLALLRDGAVLINTARGHLVDGEALERELVAGRIDAVLDTTEPEVLPAVSPLYDLPNVLLTPHIAGALAGERDRMVDLALGEIERFVRGESLEHEVRLEDWDQLA
jgi:phosphoglycerate dehydrogenase-like enzyme